jgi:hypothetical protein
MSQKMRDESDDTDMTIEDIIRIIGTEIVWTVEQDQDPTVYYSSDAENELMRIMADEIRKEIDKEVIKNINLHTISKMYQPSAIQRPTDGWHQSPLGIWIL